MATNLLDTYVGRQAGARILAGQIRRGHTEIDRRGDLALETCAASPSLPTARPDRR